MPKKLCRQTSLSKLPGKHIYTPKENEKPDKTFFVKDEVLAYPVILAYAVILASVCRISAYAEILPFKKPWFHKRFYVISLFHDNLV